MDKLITFSEVKKHNNSESCWIVIHNDVYDVTKYLGEHPGGEDALLEMAGKDGSQAFEDVGHSDDAREIMKKFKIGSLPPGECTKANPIDTNRLGFEGTTVTVYSCDQLPKIDKPEKSWRTFDGSSASYPKPEKKPVLKTPSTPTIERRVQSIVVPKERLPPCRSRSGRRGPPCEAGGSKLKWAVLALAGAVVIGFVLKKYLAS